MTRMSDKPDETPEPVKPGPKLDGPDNEWVRVKHPTTGDHYSTTRALARMAGATLIPDHDALDRYGRPYPRKRSDKKES